MGVDLSPLIDRSTEQQEDDPHFSHIVERDDNRTAEAIIMEARVNGTPVTALCGHTWIPERDPEKYPPCQKCLDLLPLAASLRH